MTRVWVVRVYRGVYTYFESPGSSYLQVALRAANISQDSGHPLHLTGYDVLLVLLLLSPGDPDSRWQHPDQQQRDPQVPCCWPRWCQHDPDHLLRLCTKRIPINRGKPYVTVTPDCSSTAVLLRSTLQCTARCCLSTLTCFGQLVLHL